MSVNQFNKGDTVILSIEIRGRLDNVLADPTTVKITISKSKVKITDVEVVKVNEVVMTKSSVGKYYYNYTSNEVGSYNVIYKADNNSKITSSRDTFIVI